MLMTIETHEKGPLSIWLYPKSPPTLIQYSLQYVTNSVHLKE